jgi:hypothetical protein
VSRPLSVVVGKHAIDGWKVSILRDGSAPVVLTAEEARTMARDLNEMADICDGKWGE